MLFLSMLGFLLLFVILAVIAAVAVVYTQIIANEE